MSKYQCWSPVDNRLPNEIIEAVTSFAARQAYAQRHHKQVTDCVARKQQDHAHAESRRQAS